MDVVTEVAPTIFLRGDVYIIVIKKIIIFI